MKDWNSQPRIGQIAEGNLFMSAAILFAGALPTKVLRIFKFIGLASICLDTFMRHQRYYLHPSIISAWCQYQAKYITHVRAEGDLLNLGGDGRADTPGHCAKYGAYSLIDLDRGVLMNVELVESNEVRGSFHMEKEGFLRNISFLKKHCLGIETMITDRHVQIVKWFKDNMSEVKHLYDVWHVAKVPKHKRQQPSRNLLVSCNHLALPKSREVNFTGLKKKLVTLAKEKDCGIVSEWIRSISNHMYWCAASTPDGNQDVIEAKWMSLINHLQDIHEGHGDLFPRCLHPPLLGRERKKKWFKPGTKACEKLMDILSSKRLLKDVRKLSPWHQTSSLEAFHSLLNHFAPKMYGFSFHGQLCRHILAAMHFNENAEREQAVRKDGELRYSVHYPKFKKGGHTLREVKEDCTYEYVANLMKLTSELCSSTTMSSEEAVTLAIPTPAPLCSQYEKINKADAVNEFKSRYATKDV